LMWKANGFLLLATHLILLALVTWKREILWWESRSSSTKKHSGFQRGGVSRSEERILFSEITRKTRRENKEEGRVSNNDRKTQKLRRVFERSTIDWIQNKGDGWMAFIENRNGVIGMTWDEDIFISEFLNRTYDMTAEWKKNDSAEITIDRFDFDLNCSISLSLVDGQVSRLTGLYLTT
jgi:hypothetical protein